MVMEFNEEKKKTMVMEFNEGSGFIKFHYHRFFFLS